MGFFTIKTLSLDNISRVAIILTSLGLSILFVLESVTITSNINPESSIQTIQKQEVQWNITFGSLWGGANDRAHSLAQTADGGFALAGFTGSYGAGESDMWLIKTNTTGHPEWNHTFGGLGEEVAYSLVQTADGGFALAGDTESYGAGEDDMWLVKTNANGQYEWDSTFGGKKDDGAYSLIQTSDGGFALAGTTDSYGTGDLDMWLVKTTSTGIAEWNVTFGGAGWNWASSLVQTADGGFTLAGFTESKGAGSGDMWLVKTTSTGIEEWNVTFGGIGYERARSLVQTADGGFALAGETQVIYGTLDYDMLLVKTTSTGIAEWNATFGGYDEDQVNSLVQTADGGFALAGYTESYGAGERDMWLVKTTSTGNREWDATFGGDICDVAYSLVQTADGGFALAGDTGYLAGPYRMWLVKTIEAEDTSSKETSSKDTSSEEKDVPGITLDIVMIFLLFGSGLIAAKRR